MTQNKETRVIGLKNSLFKSDPLVITHNLLKRKLAIFTKTYGDGVAWNNPEDIPEGIKTVKCDYSGVHIHSGSACSKRTKYITNISLLAKNTVAVKFSTASLFFTDSMPQFVFIEGGSIVSYPIDPEILAVFAADHTCIEFVGKGVFTLDSISELVKGAYDYSEYNRFNNYIGNRISPKHLDLESLYAYGIKSPTFRTTYGFKYSFGVEVECASSYMPSYIIDAFNVSCVRDGSLNGGKGGPEYVTGILVGDSGMLHLQQLLNYISGRSTIDKYCGNHVHIGGFTPTKEFSLAIFMLCYLVQNEIFELLPISRRSNEYCRKIPKNIFESLSAALTSRPPGITQSLAIEAAYDLLVEYVAALDQLGGKEAFIKSKTDKKLPLGKFLNKNAVHPLGKKCNYNHKTPRYEWLNLVPLLFNEKGKDVFTIEFRPHPASLNFSKMRYWINLCMALTAFAESKALDIIFGKVECKLENIINSTIKNQISRHSILKYLDERTKKFAGNLKETAAKAENDMYSEESFADYEDITLKDLCV